MKLRRILAGFALVVATGVTTAANNSGNKQGPPVCWACTGLHFMYCETGLNYGYAQCDFSPFAECTEWGISEDCQGLP